MPIIDLMKKQAILLAEKSIMETKHGAVLFKNKTIISYGFNKHGSDVGGYHVPAIHAEADCLFRYRTPKHKCSHFTHVHNGHGQCYQERYIVSCQN